jgi:hypothetical protein
MLSRASPLTLLVQLALSSKSLASTNLSMGGEFYEAVI